MIFMAKVCPKAINFATAESIHQLLALRPHPSGDGEEAGNDEDVDKSSTLVDNGVGGGNDGGDGGDSDDTKWC